MSDSSSVPALRLWRRFYRPTELIGWLAVGLALALTFYYPLGELERQLMLIVALFVAMYLVVFFHWALPRHERLAWTHPLPLVLNILIIAAADYLLGPQGPELELLYVVVVAIAGIMAGPRLAMGGAVLAFAAGTLVAFAHGGRPESILATQSVHFAGLLTIGYLSGHMAELTWQHASEAEGRSRQLALLLDVHRTVTASLNLYETLPRVAERIANGLPATFCRVCLLDDDDQHLVTYGVHPLRSLEGWQPSLGVRHSLAEMPRHREAIAEEHPVVVCQDDTACRLDEKECGTLFFAGMKSACLVPIVLEHAVLGTICVGEARNWQRQPFSPDKLDLLTALASEIAVVINNSRLHQSTQRQIERMAVLNEVARAISSTIEMEPLLDLIYRQLSRVISTDTYFVGLFNSQEQALEMPIVIDDGQRFPATRVPLGNGLASVVIRERRPLLVRRLSEQMDSLPVKPVVLGHDRLSESWLGVPMMSGEQILGLLAVASYRPNAFGDDDVVLLLSIAGQAAMAVDNARHHAQVEEQARRDSLTGVFNHSYLLQRLGEEVERGQQEGRPVSLIMLDIDYFKTYNDTYGHAIGDMALCLTVQAIRAHVKATDTVGRWGGEEFGIVLPGAGTDEAVQVAERVRQTLAELVLSDEAGGRLPNPTVSQGIATFPGQASNANQLVSLADKALYVAKSRGRDQVVVSAA